MITKQDAMECDEFHYGTCRTIIGKRGGMKHETTRYRRMGKTQVDKTKTYTGRNVDFYRVPVKHGMYGKNSYITPYSASQWHRADQCVPQVTDKRTVTARVVAKLRGNDAMDADMDAVIAHHERKARLAALASGNFAEILRCYARPGTVNAKLSPATVGDSLGLPCIATDEVSAEAFDACWRE